MKRRDFFEDGLVAGAAMAASVSFPKGAHSAPAKPAKEVFPFINYFGEKKTIFLVHYRNIIGKRYSFREALPDEGDTTCTVC